MKILLLEDNLNLVELILETFRDKNYKFDVFNDGKKALNAIFDGYDCFVLDINVPGKDGLSLLTEIRRLDTQTPAIIISANIDLEVIKKAYNNGCTDYIKKPFYTYELEKKFDLLCCTKKEIMLKGDFLFNVKLGKLINKNNIEINLTKKELLLMTLLSKQHDRFVSYQEIELNVWEGALTTNENIRTLIKRFRDKLHKDIIISRIGVGYKLNIINFEE